MLKFFYLLFIGLNALQFETDIFTSNLEMRGCQELKEKIETKFSDTVDMSLNISIQPF